MLSEKPTAVFDVAIHDMWERIYRVAFFGTIPDEWLEEWKQAFYEIDDLAGHASHIAEMLHKTSGLALLEGYGTITWIEHNWRRVAIWTPSGDEIAWAAVKLIDATDPTRRYDYVTTENVEWEGFNVAVNKQ
jgi:hypothetical protein